jgi:hypothetical protein
MSMLTKLKLNIAKIQSSKTNLLIGIVILLLILIIAFLGYNFVETQREIERLKNPLYMTEWQEEYNDTILTELQNILLLPEGEPTIVNILDVEVLKKENAEFYKNAINGDILIIYTDIAIIYRSTPKDKKIINFAPVINNDTNQETSNIIENIDQE